MIMIYNAVKMLHIIGFATAFGITLATFFAYNRFWRLYEISREQGLAAFKALTFLQRVGASGLMLVLLAGITMLALSKWSFTSLLWFQIKLGLIALIFVNGFTLGRTSTIKLDHFINQGVHGGDDALKLQVNLRRFLLIQILLYIAIIFLSVFRFV